MTKTELIAKLQARNAWGKAQAEAAVDGVLEIIAGELAQGRDVALHGFGTFAIVQRTERQGRNPKTGESLTIPASKVVKFKAAKPLREAVDK